MHPIARSPAWPVVAQPSECAAYCGGLSLSEELASLAINHDELDSHRWRWR